MHAAAFREGMTMDVICTCCGEPWHIDFVLHDEPQGFDRRGPLIRACPVCEGERPHDQSREQRENLDAIAEIALMLGDDIDGFAACLEDFKLC